MLNFPQADRIFFALSLPSSLDYYLHLNITVTLANLSVLRTSLPIIYIRHIETCLYFLSLLLNPIQAELHPPVLLIVCPVSFFLLIPFDHLSTGPYGMSVKATNDHWITFSRRETCGFLATSQDLWYVLCPYNSDVDISLVGTT